MTLHIIWEAGMGWFAYLQTQVSQSWDGRECLLDLGWSITITKSVFQIFWEEEMDAMCSEGSVKVLESVIHLWSSINTKSALRSYKDVFTRTSFSGTSMHFATRQCRTTCWTIYKGMAIEEEGNGTGLVWLSPVENVQFACQHVSSEEMGTLQIGKYFTVPTFLWDSLQVWHAGMDAY